MSVEIEPKELGFPRPFNSEVSQVLRIKNVNAVPVAFKVKTTAPKQYCVRPNSGRIEPGRDVEVIVLLQAMKQEPPADARCRDKFLVQSVVITGDKDNISVSQIWDTVIREDVLEKKIRVIWLASGDTLQPASAATPLRQSQPFIGIESASTPPPVYSSLNMDHSAISNSPETPARAMHEEPATLTASLAKAVENAAETTTEELRHQLAQAEATIFELKKQTASGLRQRRTSEKEESASTDVKIGAELAHVARQATKGVPVPVVVALVLTVFLLVYFFF